VLTSGLLCRQRALAKTILYAAVTLTVAGWGPPSIRAGETLNDVRARGTLRCGVSEGIAGFSAKDSSGRWAGISTPALLTMMSTRPNALTAASSRDDRVLLTSLRKTSRRRRVR